METATSEVVLSAMEASSVPVEQDISIPPAVEAGGKVEPASLEILDAPVASDVAPLSSNDSSLANSKSDVGAAGTGATEAVTGAIDVADNATSTELAGLAPGNGPVEPPSASSSQPPDPSVSLVSPWRSRFYGYVAPSTGHKALAF